MSNCQFTFFFIFYLSISLLQKHRVSALKESSISSDPIKKGQKNAIRFHNYRHTKEHTSNWSRTRNREKRIQNGAESNGGWAMRNVHQQVQQTPRSQSCATTFSNSLYTLFRYNNTVNRNQEKYEGSTRVPPRDNQDYPRINNSYNTTNTLREPPDGKQNQFFKKRWKSPQECFFRQPKRILAKLCRMFFFSHWSDVEPTTKRAKLFITSRAPEK